MKLYNFFRKGVSIFIAMALVPCVSAYAEDHDNVIGISVDEAELIGISDTDTINSFSANTSVTNMAGSGISADAYILTDVSGVVTGLETVKRLYMRFDLSQLSDIGIVSADLQFNIKNLTTGKASTVNIYSADEIACPLADIPTEYEEKINELTSISNTDNKLDSFTVRGMGTSTTYTCNNGVTAVRSITDYIKKRVDDGALTATVLIEFAAGANNSAYTLYLAAAGTDYAPTLQVKKETAPTAEDVLLSGTAVIGKELKVEYTYKGDIDEGETGFEWFIADKQGDDFVNEEFLANETESGLVLTDYMTDRYIRVKIIPRASEGRFSIDGDGECNTYYSDFIGPVKSEVYLDEITAGIWEFSEPDDIYSYLKDNDNILNLGFEEIELLNQREKVVSLILERKPLTYLDLVDAVYCGRLLARVSDAEAGEVLSVIEDKRFGLDLSIYALAKDKNAVAEALAYTDYRSTSELQTALDRVCMYISVKAAETPYAVADALNSGKSLFSTDISGCSYGVLLLMADYLIDNADIFSSFDELDAVLPEALRYAEEKYESGFVTVRTSFMTDAYIKVDFKENVFGDVSNATLSSGRYVLSGVKNSANAKQYAAIKLDLSSLPDYELASAKMFLYGTAGGGANKILNIKETGEFDGQDDFISRYPTGESIITGDIISDVQYSYGTVEWQSADITDYIREQIHNGESCSYMLLDFENSEGSDPSKSGYVYNINHAEYAPYVELVFETPPVAKDIRVIGARTVGAKLTLKYDYYGCYSEGVTKFAWYSADNVNGEYINVSPIEGQTGQVLDLTPELAGKCIFAEITPASSKGAYKYGSVASSGFTMPILDAVQAGDLLTRINSANTAEQIETVIRENNDVLCLDIEHEHIANMTKVMKAAASAAHKSIQDFEEYFDKAIIMQRINEAEADAIDGIIAEGGLGIDLSRYNNLKDKSPIISAVYAKDFETVEALYSAFNEACLVNEFSGVDHSNVKELLLFYDFMLDGDVASLSSSDLTVVCNSFMTHVKTPVTSLNAINSALNSALAYLRSYTPSITPTGGGGGGGGGGGTSQRVTSVSVPAQPTTNTLTPVVNEYVFDDIVTVAEWAGDQITKLYNRKVIDGDGDGRFRPNDSVSREEFVKMIVTAFDISSETPCGFEDVPSDAWYYEYVSVAYGAGIVSGIDETHFGTGLDITRQDMAVLLYRILLRNKVLVAEANGSNHIDDYIDKDEISDYAIEAVGVFTKQGIVNGIGDGMFAPGETATRAMAAVMLCNVMELVGE